MGFAQGFKETWSSFLPFCLFAPSWILVGTREGAFAEAISSYYAMMIAMIIGSMIAGSTPLGGGIVAFPVSVMILGFRSSMGRDFSLLIQSFGMSSATYLIFYRKSHLLEGRADLLATFEALSGVGLVIGMGPVSKVLSAYVVDLIYATVVVCIVLVFIYEDILVRMAAPAEDRPPSLGDIEEEDEHREGLLSKADRPSANSQGRRRSSILDMARNVDPSLADPPEDTGEHGTKLFVVSYLLLPVFAIVGGILSSQIGSGSDIAFYLYGSILNAVNGQAGRKRMSGNTLTAISVIVMATMSVFGSLLRITAVGDEDARVMREVYLCLLATSPIVTLGAPTGSLLLKPAYEQYLKLLFYFLGFAQLVVFGLLKFKADPVAWGVVGGCIGFVLLVIGAHFGLSQSKKRVMDAEGDRVSGHSDGRPSLLAATL